MKYIHNTNLYRKFGVVRDRWGGKKLQLKYMKKYIKKAEKILEKYLAV